MKKIFLICGIILCVFLLFTPAMLLSIYGTTKGNSYSPPKVTYGEFPFKLVYKLNGEEYTVEDTVICEYIKTEYDWNKGKRRIWKRYLASNPKEEDILITKGFNRAVYFFIGDAEYYMGDSDLYYGEFPFVPHVYISKYISVFSATGSLSQEEILKHYGIEIVSWEFSDPIENSFSE